MFFQKLLKIEAGPSLKSLMGWEIKHFEDLFGALYPRFIVRGRRYVNTLVFSGDINTNCLENDKAQHIKRLVFRWQNSQAEMHPNGNK